MGACLKYTLKGLKMKFELNTQEFTLDFGNDRVEKIYIDATDPDILIRVAKFGNNISEWVDENKGIAENIQISENGEIDNKTYIKQYDDLVNKIYQEIDNAFKTEISSKAFKYCSPFAIVNGEYYLAQFLKAITIEIIERIQKANKIRNEEINSLISNYKESQK